MGAAASVNKEFAKDMKNKGFKEQILKAKTDDEKIRVFNALQEEVRLYFAATQIQAAARKKLANQSLSGGSLHEIFLKFCRFGKGQSNTTELDGKRWAKFCKENKFYTINKKAFNATGADMVFAKVCRKAKFMSFNQFKDEALPEVASRCGVDVSEVLGRIADPKNSGTKADYSKFHDDRSTWTGVALEGGPSTNDAKISLSSQANRDNKADVRGVVH
mmetsp:Transcript_18562/g.27196  ORF Transcript_18562/g.27196 Transcript_18562/m.27196 type:complete len:218 (+) Transcript_18562:92-745(+)|eukprot:CAMPEP_0195521890 /NCGR_PEP_ID=MMETSP0794_2-20130614/19608_1 /TAXON_ID=515487 /ORGANISM="Stephanopyxis turris, Strain CCMP 815" /LENGTH=217 /DNA_ID=CAMNT_0040651533 /DNA_START=84 /DNA_END=737 /DNA_ORIENTATION=+